MRRREAVVVWADIVGEKIASATEARDIRDGVLRVACRSSVWANELMMLKPQLLKRLSEAVGQAVVKDIRFSAERLPKIPPPPVISDEAQAVTTDPAVEAEAEAAAKAVAELVKDAELSAKIHRAVRTATLGEAWKVVQGWKKCEKCGALHNESGDLCAVCRLR